VHSDNQPTNYNSNQVISDFESRYEALPIIIGGATSINIKLFIGASLQLVRRLSCWHSKKPQMRVVCFSVEITAFYVTMTSN
jgi:hypothetical protein